MLLLSCITFGIYGIYVWVCYAKDMNILCKGDGKESPGYAKVLLLGIITCGVYSVYWFYMQEKRLYEAAPGYGVIVKEKGSTVLLWMTVGSLLFGIGPFIGMYILLKNRNMLAEQYNRGIINTMLNKNEKEHMSGLVKILCVLGGVAFFGNLVVIVVTMSFLGLSSVNNDLADDWNLMTQNEFYEETTPKNFYEEPRESEVETKPVREEVTVTDNSEMAALCIDVLKNSNYMNLSNVTYEEAFTNFFADPEWEYAGAENDSSKVKFSGSCIYDGVERKMEIIFYILPYDNFVEPGSFLMDGEVQSNELRDQLLEVAFQTYNQ